MMISINSENYFINNLNGELMSNEQIIKSSEILPVGMVELSTEVQRTLQEKASAMVRLAANLNAIEQECRQKKARIDANREIRAYKDAKKIARELKKKHELVTTEFNGAMEIALADFRPELNFAEKLQLIQRNGNGNELSA